MDEILGVCEYCGQDVVYRPGMPDDDPDYPFWGFSEQERRDFVYHQRHMER
jgi:hypothetical protein